MKKIIANILFWLILIGIFVNSVAIPVIENYKANGIYAAIIGFILQCIAIVVMYFSIKFIIKNV